MHNITSELKQSPRRPLLAKRRPTVMRKLVQSKVTKRFLTWTGGWTRDIHKAADFGDTAQVRAAMQRFRLKRVQLYYLFHDNPDCDYNFAVPL